MLRTRNRIIGTATKRSPATPSERRAPGAPLAVRSRSLLARLATPASLDGVIATTVRPVGRLLVQRLVDRGLRLGDDGAGVKALLLDLVGELVLERLLDVVVPGHETGSRLCVRRLRDENVLALRHWDILAGRQRNAALGPLRHPFDARQVGQQGPALILVLG